MYKNFALKKRADFKKWTFISIFSEKTKFKTKLVKQSYCKTKSIIQNVKAGESIAC